MSTKKNTKKGKKIDDEIIVSSIPDTKPAEEKEPDQKVLDTPKPKLGMGLIQSWKSPK